MQGLIDPKAGSVVISAYQWRAAKLKPKKYGDVSKLMHTGADGEGPAVFQVVSTIPRPPKESE